jgi:hypothetical protein
MRICTESVTLPKSELKIESLKKAFPSLKHPVRFVVTKSEGQTCSCEVDCLCEPGGYRSSLKGIFDYSIRKFENTDRFNAVLVIPTGIGAEIGGHCGDANAVARLVASACDTLITHPNVVNAADMNEMTENTLYVEGSLISRLLMGTIGLQKVKGNRVLLLMDKHRQKAFNDGAVNMVSTARVCLGMHCDVVQMDDIAKCAPSYTKTGKASGEIRKVERIFDTLAAHKQQYDAFALTTHVEVPAEMEEAYYTSQGGVNPWGGIEAMLTHSLALAFDAPCAHSPMSISLEVSNYTFEKLGVIEPRKASETFSRTYLYCILKGLHRAPRIVQNGGLTVADVSCLIIPDGCVGLPTLASLEQGIPVIAVRENRNVMRNQLQDLPFKPGKLFIVDNYLEAVGVMTALKAGVTPAAVRRPLSGTRLEKQL